MSWYEDAAKMLRVNAAKRYRRKSERIYVRAQRLLDKSDRVYAKAYEMIYDSDIPTIDIEVVD